MTKFFCMTAGVAVIGALGFVIDRQSLPPTHRPERTERNCTICALGRVEGVTPEVELRTQLQGRITHVRATEGQWVERGDVLLELDGAEYAQEVALAAADLRLAEAQLQRRLNGARQQELEEAAAYYQAKQADLERAELAWNRIQELRRTNAVSAQQADDQRTLVAACRAEVAAARARFELLDAPARADEVAMDRARIEAAKARLDLAKVQLERTRLYAPTRGRVLEVTVEPGELTGPAAAEPAIVIVDTSRYRVRAFVDELDAPRIQVGMTARMTADGMPETVLRGRVARSCPRMGRKQLWSDDPTERCDTKTREVWIDLDEMSDLVVGLRVDVVVDPASLVPTPSPSRSPERLPPLEAAGVDSLAATRR